ncbi:unnamed protein product [Nezara viridula]|uniref:Solute carrier organic anion transporter family member n=1 Tax=Nezara viridula TaxID=85310 RepID=A0A9P0HD96_NEZVI|nr:unnamed protein product [Nezara viridula]
MYEALQIEERQTGEYGWCGYTPQGLQKFRSPKWALAFCCSAAFVQGVIVNGLLHYFLPMIERRFELISTEAGLMTGAYDIASGICLIPVTYYGGQRRAHRPHYIGTGVIIMGTGSLIFSLPAFMAGPYKQYGFREICFFGIEHPLVKVPCNNCHKLFWLLFFGNLLHGIGASPLYTLAVTFIDESFPLETASLYLGIYYMMSVLGPFVGIVMGGSLSHIDGDFLYSVSHKSELTPSSPTWVGCWWLGFICCGLACYVFSLPIFGLPKELPETSIHRASREEIHTEPVTLTFTSIKELPRAIFQILENFKFLFITLGGCCEGLIFSGMGSFLTKILQQQFGLGPGEQAIFMCILTVPSTLTGIIVGGWVVKHFRMNLQHILIMVVTLMIATLPCISALFISCPSDDLVGFTIPYQTDNIVKQLKRKHLLLNSDCNNGCGCEESYFNPVCGIDNRTYFSGCFAGCLEMNIRDQKKEFFNCKCIPKEKATKVSGPEAYEGACKTLCPSFPLFLALIFIYQTLSFASLIPSVTSTLRVVHTDVRSLAMGVQWLMGRLLGTIPGPIVFGAAIDESCGYWYKHLDQEGKKTCLHYIHGLMSRNLAIVIFSSKILEITFFSIALHLAMKSQKNEIE